MHTHTHTYKDTDIDTDTYTYTYTHTPLCKHKSTSTRKRARGVRTRTHAQTHMHTHKRLCKHKSTLTRTRVISCVFTLLALTYKSALTRKRARTHPRQAFSFFFLFSCACMHTYAHSKASMLRTHARTHARTHTRTHAHTHTHTHNTHTHTHTYTRVCAHIHGTATGATNADVCVTCQQNSFSAAGSRVNTNCTCNHGYSGPDGGECTACQVGKFKLLSGSQSCSDCPLGDNIKT
jgi:hypothetical protein